MGIDHFHSKLPYYSKACRTLQLDGYCHHDIVSGRSRCSEHWSDGGEVKVTQDSGQDMGAAVVQRSPSA